MSPLTDLQQTRCALEYQTLRDLGLGNATFSAEEVLNADDTAEDIAILDVGTCTAEISGAIIA